MPKSDRDELLIITKVYDLILWSGNHTSRFPKNHRYVLGERIEVRLYDLLETLIKAKYASDKLELLQCGNLALELLRYQYRLASDQKCIATKSYVFAVKCVDEIGRLLGAWLRQQTKSRNGSKRDPQ